MHIIIKSLKNKWQEKILIRNREKKKDLPHTVTKTHMTADFLVELLQAMRQWSITFKVLKKEKEKKKSQPGILYPAKTSSRIKATHT